MKLKQIAKELNQIVLGREDVFGMIMVSLLAREHIAVVGAPGTSKSFMFNSVAERIVGGSHFYCQVDKFTPPEVFFGPLSLKALEQDNYIRNLEGTMPLAHTAFVDEFFKGGSATLNLHLNLLNERYYKNGSDGLVKSPLMSVFAASNEYPSDDGGDSVEALWDRFLIRMEVEYLGREQVFEMLKAGLDKAEAATHTTVTVDEMETMQTKVRQVEVGDDALWALADLGAACMDEHGIQITDRRTTKAVRLLQAKAFYEGDTAVKPSHFCILEHVLWSDVSQRAAIKKEVSKVVSPYASELIELKEQMTQAGEDVKSGVLDHFSYISQSKAALARLKEMVELETATETKRAIQAYRGALSTRHREISAMATGTALSGRAA